MWNTFAFRHVRAIPFPRQKGISRRLRRAISRGMVSALALSVAAADADTGRSRSYSAPPRLLAHTMPWFEAPPVSPRWGWHWTMNHFDPEKMAGGRRSIAAHDYPLIGPYDSSDPDVLEYHALLMKVAGIDGSVLDWYGSTDFWDYGAIHRNTLRWIETLRRFGLTYAICYEDQSVGHMVETGRLTRAKAVAEAAAQLRWLARNAFTDRLYEKWRGAPVLLVYGPEFLHDEEWATVLSGIEPRPAVFMLDHPHPGAAGVFAWPPMWKATGKTLTAASLDDYLDRFYAGPGPRIGMAVPAFHDRYGEAGARPSYAVLDPAGGETLRHTLDRALRAGGPFVQLVTWNDFGEGTEVEPTVEFGEQDLEIIQDRARTRFKHADLRMPYVIYGLRKSPARGSLRALLDRAVDRLAAGRVGEAQRLLNQARKASVSPRSTRRSPA